MSAVAVSAALSTPVAALVGPVPEVLEDSPTRPSRLHVHLGNPGPGDLPCGKVRGYHVESRNPAQVTCRPCLEQGQYPTEAEALLALGRLGVQVLDTAQAQARGLLVAVKGQHLWRLDLATAGKPFTTADADALVDWFKKEQSMLVAGAPLTAEDEREETEVLPEVPAAPPIHYADWGRCLDERDDDRTSPDPKQVTCAECKRLMAEDAAEDAAPYSALTAEQQQAGEDAVLTPVQEQELLDKMRALLEENAALTSTELAEDAAGELRLHLDDFDATIPVRVFELALVVKEGK